MAKANDTTIEKMFRLIDTPGLTPEQILGIIMDSKKELLKSERSQIEVAFLTALRGGYHDAGHYFFINYIDND